MSPLIRRKGGGAASSIQIVSEISAEFAANIPTVRADKIGFMVNVAGDFENSPLISPQNAHFKIGDHGIWNDTMSKFVKIDSDDNLVDEDFGPSWASDNLNAAPRRALHQKITSVDNAIAQEGTDRATNDSALQASITQEVNDRASADNTLQSSIDQEVSDRGNADNTLQGSIGQEVTNRIAGDNALQANIDQEIADRLAQKDDILALAPEGGAGIDVGNNALTGSVSDIFSTFYGVATSDLNNGTLDSASGQFSPAPSTVSARVDSVNSDYNISAGTYRVLFHPDTNDAVDEVMFVHDGPSVQQFSLEETLSGGDQIWSTTLESTLTVDALVMKTTKGNAGTYFKLLDSTKISLALGGVERNNLNASLISELDGLRADVDGAQAGQGGLQGDIAGLQAGQAAIQNELDGISFPDDTTIEEVVRFDEGDYSATDADFNAAFSASSQWGFDVDGLTGSLAEINNATAVVWMRGAGAGDINTGNYYFAFSGTDLPTSASLAGTGNNGVSIGLVGDFAGKRVFLLTATSYPSLHAIQFMFPSSSTGRFVQFSTSPPAELFVQKIKGGGVSVNHLSIEVLDHIKAQAIKYAIALG